MSCSGGVGGECVFWMEDSHVVYSVSDLFTYGLSWEISMGWLIEIVVEEADLGLVCM